VEELVGAEGGFFVAEVEVGVGVFAGAFGADDFDSGVVGEEGWRGVGCGGGVADVAAEGGAVLVGDGAGPGGGLDEEREVGGDGLAAADVGEGGAGADVDGVVVDADEAELVEVVDGEEGFLREAACAEGDHELGAAGDGGVLAGVAIEHGEDGR